MESEEAARQIRRYKEEEEAKLAAERVMAAYKERYRVKNARLLDWEAARQATKKRNAPTATVPPRTASEEGRPKTKRFKADSKKPAAMQSLPPTSATVSANSKKPAVVRSLLPTFAAVSAFNRGAQIEYRGDKSAAAAFKAPAKVRVVQRKDSTEQLSPNTIRKLFEEADF